MCKVKGSESEYDRLLEIGEKHSHKTDRGEVVDATHLILVFIQWDTELVPCDIFSISITEFHTAHTFIYDEILSHH